MDQQSVADVRSVFTKKQLTDQMSLAAAFHDPLLL